MTIRQALLHASGAFKTSGISTHQLDAEVLLAHLLGIERSYIFAHGEDTLTDKQGSTFHLLVRKRAQRIPIAYLTGHKEFFGKGFTVKKGVLIPRPDTETLVQCVLDYHTAHSDKKTLLDIGTGSGCIAIALSSKIPDVMITATDTSSQALRIAAMNIRHHGLSKKIQLKKADLYPPTPKEFDIIISNPPYLSAKEYATARKKYPELAFEPRSALVASHKGLGIIEKIIKSSISHLTQHGALFLEIGSGQSMSVRRLAKKYLPQATVTFHKDLAGKTRVARIECY